MKKRKKLMLFAILIFLLSASASGAYAYWAGTVNAPDQKTDTININIGEAKPVNTMLTVSELPTLPKLVPAGQKNNSLDSDNCVEMIVANYNVSLIPDPEMSIGYRGIQMGFRLIVGEITIGGSTLNNDLVNVTAYWYNAETGIGVPVGWNELYPIMVGDPRVYNNETLQIKLEITLTEPTNKDLYNQIKGKPIAIPLTFKAVLPPPPIP